MTLILAICQKFVKRKFLMIWSDLRTIDKYFYELIVFKIFHRGKIIQITPSGSNGST